MSCRLTLAIVAPALLVSSSLYAQARVQVKGAAAPPARETVREPVRDQRPAPRAEVVEDQRDDQVTRVSEFLDSELVMDDGKSLGVVRDLVIANASGQVQYVVVETDGQMRAVPWKSLAFNRGDNAKDRYFTIDMDRERFEKAPAIPQKDWTNYSNQAWTTYVPQVNKYYSDVRPVRPGVARRQERRAERNQ
jgi:sporulation protein YlmC with PRC-barrel domain